MHIMCHVKYKVVNLAKRIELMEIFFCIIYNYKYSFFFLSVF